MASYNYKDRVQVHLLNGRAMLQRLLAHYENMDAHEESWQPGDECFLHDMNVYIKQVSDSVFHEGEYAPDNHN